MLADLLVSCITHWQPVRGTGTGLSNSSLFFHLLPEIPYRLFV